MIDSFGIESRVDNLCVVFLLRTHIPQYNCPFAFFVLFSFWQRQPFFLEVASAVLLHFVLIVPEVARYVSAAKHIRPGEGLYTAR